MTDSAKLERWFKQAVAPKKFKKAYSTFRRVYYAGLFEGLDEELLFQSVTRAEKNAAIRLNIIKWGIKKGESPKCPRCQGSMSEVRRAKVSQNKMLTYRCRICRSRGEVDELSCVKNTELGKTRWKPRNLLMAAFYVANVSAPRAVTLAEVAGVDRATARNFIEAWIYVSLEREIDLNNYERSKPPGKKHSKYGLRSFYLLKELLKLRTADSPKGGEATPI